MATTSYLSGRKKYGRPQAILFSDNPGQMMIGNYGKEYLVPMGIEYGAKIDGPEGNNPQFLILSDHNRQPLDIKPMRIEKRERTINGSMRSFHTADKDIFSTSWSDLPSRGFSSSPDFNAESGGAYGLSFNNTVDGGAGGVELLDWYNSHPGSFYMFLAYDKRSNFGVDQESYDHLQQYQEAVKVFFSDFSYTVTKRGQNSFDLWNISMSLEEV